MSEITVPTVVLNVKKTAPTNAMKLHRNGPITAQLSDSCRCGPESVRLASKGPEARKLVVRLTRW